MLDRLVKLVASFSYLSEKSSSDFKKTMVFKDVDLVDFHAPNLLAAKILGS